MEDQYLPFTKDGVTLREGMEVFREPTISVDDSGRSKPMNDISNPKPLTIGEIIAELRKHDPSLEVWLNFCGMRPTDVELWRWDQCSPCLAWDNNPNDSVSVKVLIERLERALIEDHLGHKDDYVRHFHADQVLMIKGSAGTDATVITAVREDEYDEIVWLCVDHDWDDAWELNPRKNRD